MTDGVGAADPAAPISLAVERLGLAASGSSAATVVANRTRLVASWLLAIHVQTATVGWGLYARGGAERRC